AVRGEGRTSRLLSPRLPSSIHRDQLGTAQLEGTTLRRTSGLRLGLRARLRGRIRGARRSKASGRLAGSVEARAQSACEKRERLCGAGLEILGARTLKTTLSRARLGLFGGKLNLIAPGCNSSGST